MHKHNSRHNSHPAEPKNEEIARLAYSFFESEGRLNGHDLEHWLRAREQLFKARSSENKSQKDARPESTPTNNHAEEKVLSANPPRGRGEERYSRASAGR
jgi:hypothetical protein